MPKKVYTYHVLLELPTPEKKRKETNVQATSQQDAKCKATTEFYDHQFTGVHKYMKATRV